jgi:hypothetical protein
MPTTYSVATGAHKHTLPVGAYVGMGIGAAIVLVALFCLCTLRKKLNECKWFPFARSRHSTPGYNASTADKDEEERQKRSRLSTQRRRRDLKAYINSGAKERLKSWVHGQAREVSDPTLTHVGLQPVPPGHIFTRTQPPARPMRPTSNVDSIIATMQHGRRTSRPITQYSGDEENGIELEETNDRETRSYRPEYTGPVYDPYIPTDPETRMNSLQPRPRRAASSIYSQQTSQPHWARGSVNTNTMDNAFASTFNEYNSGSEGSQPPHYSVVDSGMFPQSSASPRAANTYSQYQASEGVPQATLPAVDRYKIDEDEDDEEKRERERKRALDLLVGNEPEPSARSVRDTGLSGLFGLRKINK